MNMKRIVSLVCAGMTLLFTLLALCFEIYRVNLTDGMNSVRGGVNGFEILTESPGMKLGVWLDVFSYLLLILVCTEIITVLCTLRCQKFGLIIDVLVVLNVLLVLTYMINGQLAVSQILKFLSNASEEVSMWGRVETSSFVPLIIVAFFAIAYFVLKFLDRKSDKKTVGFNEGKEQKKHKVKKSEERKIEFLIQYKKLYDEGVINKEEYERKKAELL